MLDAQVVKRRRGLTVDVTLRTVGTGEIVGLFGASGAGKSTVLSCIAGIEVLDDGFVRFDGVQLDPPHVPLHRRPIGYLTQAADLFPHLRVAQNVRFGLNGSADPAWLAELRERLQLDELWHAPATLLSGGQARRVALARMLARRPPLVLLDEPFAGLDRGIVRDLIEHVLDWQRRLRFTLIVVDHQAQVLERFATRVVVIEAGRVVQDAGWPQIRSAPATPLLASLVAPL
ncbi:MAG: ATP-binding cassette domain-containing protein [Vulcanimicrobiaceae bacterium]